MEPRMPKQPFARALLYSAGAALLILVLVLAFRHFLAAPETERAEANRFNPALYAAAPRLDAPNVASDTDVVDPMPSRIGTHA